MNKEEIINAIESMTVLDLSQLVKELETKFGVSAMPVFSGAVQTGASSSASSENVEEKTSFSVVLSSGGDKKIQVIKIVREATGLGLKEAKDLVEGAPKPVKENIPKKEAEELKAKIEEAGGSVEIK